jgi:hypothetical protein
MIGEAAACMNGGLADGSCSMIGDATRRRLQIRKFTV